MRFWDYLKKNRVVYLIAVITIMVIFYAVGFLFPEVDHVVEGRYLLLIIGIPTTIFLVVSFIQWKKK